LVAVLVEVDGLVVVLVEVAEEAADEFVGFCGVADW
jgi:hypothetical protein